MEREILKELSRIFDDAEVLEVEKEYANAVIFTIAGNVISSVVVSRYGGEDVSL